MDVMESTEVGYTVMYGREEETDEFLGRVRDERVIDPWA